MAPRRFVWTGQDRDLEARALRMRALNPLRHGPRRKPRDPDAFAALARVTLQLVRDDRRFQRIGPRAWRLVAQDDPRAVRPLR